MIAVYIISAIILLLAVGYFTVFVRPRGRAPKNKALLCDYAHRGLHTKDIPENSLEAFEHACREGYGIELDVQLSRDGTVIVFHDYTLTRMTRVDKKVCELDARELTKLSLNGSAQCIPTFSQVLSLVNGRVPLLVELKGEDLSSSLCPKVAELLKEYSGDYCIESFNPLLIKRIKKYLPHAYCGQLYTNVCRDKKNYNPLNMILTGMCFNFIARPDFIAYNKLDRHSTAVRLATRKAPRFVWTIKNDYEMHEAKSYGEHAIFEINK